MRDNTQNIMRYRYYMCGMFTGTDGNRYDICIPSPFVRNSKGEAMKDENFAYRFCAIDSAEPMLSRISTSALPRRQHPSLLHGCYDAGNRHPPH